MTPPLDLPPTISDEDDDFDQDEGPAPGTGPGVVEQLVGGELTPEDPFAARPLDPAAVTGTPEEQLAAVETALHIADETARASLKAAKARWTIETGAALRILVQRDLYLAAGYTALDDYARERLNIARQYVYELIEDAARLEAVHAARLRVSDRSDSRILLASHARILAPLLELPGGKAKAQAVLDQALAGGKLSTNRLRAAARRLGYATAALPAARKTGEDSSGFSAADRQQVNTELERGAEALERLLERLDRIDKAAVPPADAEAAELAVKKIKAAGRRLARTARVPGPTADDGVVDAEVL